MAFSIFVINLEDRVDRWQDCMAQTHKVDFPLRRVDAVKPQEVKSEIFTTPNIAACWESHRKAMLQLLESRDDFALILEDDFFISNRTLNFDVEEFRNTGLDFLQIGFLKTTWREAIYIVVENLHDRFVRLYGRMELIFFRSPASRKILVRERVGLGSNFVFADVRPGAHAYIINREGALYFTQLNKPIFLSTDDLFMATAPMRRIRMARLRKSVVSQSGSASSIRV
jgi:GR25 family glycosyltransferase involved in LPS biosynthesis